MENTVSTRVELKYCELCGGLWLRVDGNREIYCSACAPQMREMANPKKKPPVSEKSVFAFGGAVCA